MSETVLEGVICYLWDSLVTPTWLEVGIEILLTVGLY